MLRDVANVLAADLCAASATVLASFEHTNSYGEAATVLLSCGLRLSALRLDSLKHDLAAQVIKALAASRRFQR